MQNQLVGFYLADKKNKIFCTTEEQQLIICGEITSFPPHDSNNMQFYSIEFGTIMQKMFEGGRQIVMDRSAFQNFTRCYYSFCVETIGQNALTLTDMTNDDFISPEFQFNKFNYKPIKS